MSDIRYDGQNDFRSRQYAPAHGGFDLTGKLVTWKIAKDRDQSALILAGVAGVALLVMLYSLYSLVSGPESSMTKAQADAAFKKSGIPTMRNTE